MYQLKKPAMAGTLESSDAQILVAPNPDGGLEITIESPVKTQFGHAIRATAECVLTSFGITSGVISIIDKGAIDVVIRSRLQTAVCRSAEKPFEWKGEAGKGGDGHAA